ncbi:hypothetical protein EVAR_45525_1 [Eumeta japonica]|uniref:Uncharacterized protein n=1 Tax=Eumeta variegata TaxID=151549 RepID=A0A4C1XAM1_EUMVA|nr:hypothetical protein EVAR_45525_1 [Eumeta japonica]
MSNVETKRLRMNHTNIQKQTLKALHQAKKTENGRQMEETCPFLLRTVYSHNYMASAYPVRAPNEPKLAPSESSPVAVEVPSAPGPSTRTLLPFKLILPVCEDMTAWQSPTYEPVGSSIGPNRMRRPISSILPLCVWLMSLTMTIAASCFDILCAVE